VSLPKFPDKHGRPATFTVDDLLARGRGGRPPPVPEAMILCFQDRVYRDALRRYRGRPVKVPYGEVALLRRAAGGQVGIAGRFGIGAPAAVFMLEWLAALGARRFIAIGYAGGLLERQRAGDLVVCRAALRDEGTSHHYLPPTDYSRPDETLTAALSTALTGPGYAHEFGATWTTDAPLRETFAEIEHYRAQGILTVEMEAAALFAASEHLGTACAAAFAVGDGPRDGKWDVDFDRKALQAGLDRLTEAAVETLQKPAG
jgi:uridine phosphorylase